MNTRVRTIRVLSAIVLAVAVGAIWLLNTGVAAQQAGQAAAQPAQGRGPAPPGPTPQSTAPFDVTGYWVSVVTEDWRWRMVTPSKGDVDGVPLNPAGLKAVLAWDYQKDVVAAGAACKAYGAAAIMRMPTRIHVTWQDSKTLKLETDAGQQTRIFYFDPAKQFTPGPHTMQGNSVAQWIDVTAGRGGGRGAAAANANAEEAAPLGAAAQLAQGGGGGGAAAAAPPPGQGRVGGAVTVGGAAAALGGGGGDGRGGRGRAAYGNGTLKVVTTNVKGGYLRKNGVPYDDNAVVTEYFDRLPGPDNTQWLIVRTTVEDPMYLNAPMTVSSNFKLEPNAAKWRPEACQIDPPLIPGEHRRIPFRPADVETIR